MQIKVDFARDRMMRVRFSGRTWDLAHDVIEHLKENPPNGYKLVSSQVNTRGQTRSGTRCNIMMLFTYVDSRVTPLTANEGREWFVPFSAQAQGVN